jgi:hypothetical protein
MVEFGMFAAQPRLHEIYQHDLKADAARVSRAIQKEGDGGVSVRQWSRARVISIRVGVGSSRDQRSARMRHEVQRLRANECRTDPSVRNNELPQNLSA